MKNTVALEAETYRKVAEMAEDSGLSKGAVLKKLLAIGASNLASSGRAMARKVVANPDNEVEAIGDDELAEKVLNKVNNKLGKEREDELADRVLNKVRNKPALFELAPVEADGFKCGGCEAELEDEYLFCPECGVKLAWGKEEKGGGVGWFGVGLGALVLLSLMSRQGNRIS